jgi:hypothetical protein
MIATSFAGSEESCAISFTYATTGTDYDLILVLRAFDRAFAGHTSVSMDHRVFAR